MTILVGFEFCLLNEFDELFFIFVLNSLYPLITFKLIYGSYFEMEVDFMNA